MICQGGRFWKCTLTMALALIWNENMFFDKSIGHAFFPFLAGDYQIYVSACIIVAVERIY